MFVYWRNIHIAAARDITWGWQHWYDFRGQVFFRKEFDDWELARGAFGFAMPFSSFLSTFSAAPCSDKSLSLNILEQSALDKFMHLEFKIAFLLARGNIKVCFL